MSKVSNYYRLMMAAIFAAMCGMFSIFSSANVFAADGSSWSGSGGSCSDGTCCYCTDYGATWLWYEWPAGYSSVSVNMDYGPSPWGYKDYTPSFFPSSVTVTGCADAGGYYLYGMVNSYDHKQHGALGIDGHEKNVYNAKALGGGMEYIESQDSKGHTLSWNYVKQLYDQAVSLHQATVGWGNGKGLTWFCSAEELGYYITVKYVGEQKYTDCEGNTTVTEVNLGEYKYGTFAYTKDATIDSIKVGELKAQGWSYQDISGDLQYIRRNDNNSILVMKPNDTKKDLSVTYKLVKEDREMDCVSKACLQWAPNSYLTSDTQHGETSAVIAVRNTSVSNNNNAWHHMTETGSPGLQLGVVYAKPQDKVQWQYCYFPGAQVPINAPVTVDNADPHPLVPEDGGNTTTLNNSTFIEAYGDEWQNFFKVSSTNLVAGYNDSDEFPIGSADTRGDADDYQVRPRLNEGDRTSSNVGQTLVETIVTGTPSYAHADGPVYHSWACNASGYSLCEHTNQFFRNEHYGTATDHADVIIPYNYRNTATVEVKKDQGYVYAGEEVTVQTGAVYVNERWNAETQGEYSTVVPGGKAKLLAYLKGEDASTEGERRGVDPNDEAGVGLCGVLGPKNERCGVLAEASNGFNLESKLDGYIEGLEDMVSNKQYNVFDDAAGNYYCVVLAVWPYEVNGDVDTTREGSNNWYISQPSCVVIAKKPTFQVWGAGVYSAGDIVSSMSNKSYVRGYDEWAPKGGTHTMFSSWGELSATAEGQVRNFASGATVGYRGGVPATPYREAPYTATYYGLGYPGGLKGSSSSFCVRSPLSIANVNCNTSVGGFAVNDVKSSIETDKAALLSRFANGAAGAGIEVVDLSEVGPDSLGMGATKVNIHSGTVQINGDITVPNGTYSTLGQIPKYIIYAKGGDIIIGCNVHQIDAVLIADGNVNTCNNSDVNSAARSGQLIINGAVVTGSMTLNRTFGAGPGGKSITPAELINYDSSLYLWAHRMAAAGYSGLLTETASRELPPRY